MSGSQVEKSARIFIGGPTASGKSALALDLADRLDGEIISVDCMQVYRGMDIGTAKPGREERARTPHHLVDVLDLREGFDAARFVRLAREAESGIRQRGRTPVYCGGTGLYFKALLFGLDEAPRSDAALREELARSDLHELLHELRSRDPEHFAVVDRNNRRRVERAIEVIRLTGRPCSASRTRWSDATSLGGEFVICLEHEPAELRQRIEHRVDAMFDAGLVEETDRLLREGLRENQTAMQAIGYRQVVEHLGGERSFEETVALVKNRTKGFARRQRTWFRHQLPTRWIDASGPPAELTNRALAALGLR